MYDYGARWYDPALGRFIQPDTIVPNPGDAQSFDRYAYVNNNPLKYVDPTGHCIAPAAMPRCADLIQQMWMKAQQLIVQYGPSATQFLQQHSSQLPATGDAADSVTRAVNDASQMLGNSGATGSPGGQDPDPFRNTVDSIRRGVETLRGQIGNVDNWNQYRLAARAHLSRAEYYQSQGVLQGVYPTGKGSIDLLLTNNTGVEVKYWTANYLARSTGELARQLQGFGRLNLDQIVVEFMQTQTNPVTQQQLDLLRRALQNLPGVDWQRVQFVIVNNPGIR